MKIMELSDEKYHQGNFLLLEETLVKNNETIVKVNIHGPKNQKETIEAYVNVPSSASTVFNKL